MTGIVVAIAAVLVAVVAYLWFAPSAEHYDLYDWDHDSDRFNH
jgi:nitrogen fixation-related uncharacterized protein